MNGSVSVVCNHALTDQDGIFEVITVPWHKADQHVLTQGQFTQVSRCTVSNDIPFGQFVTFFDNGTLVNISVLVRTLVFDEVVNINTHFTGLCFGIIHANHNTGCIHIIYDTTTCCSHNRTRVDCRNTLNASTHKRFFWTQYRNRLTLHVRTHQSAVGIVVFQERHQRSSHRNNLSGRYVHVLNSCCINKNRFTRFTCGYQFIG